MAQQKKSETLAYPEDAIINQSGATQIVAGNSECYEGRTVRISQLTRNVMQSGDSNAKGWKIEFDVQERWENNTMGWGSSADPIGNVANWMHFKTKEAAINFAVKSG